MKLAPDCYKCLQRLIYQAADLATEDTSLKQMATKETTTILDNEFSCGQVSIVIATKIHKVVREITHNPDPYREMKERELAIARESYPELRSRYREDLRGCIKLAASANVIDFFREASAIKDDIRKTVNFALDDSEWLEARLRETNRVLYLADNTGEMYFDLPLVKYMRRFVDVIYVVKPSPVQDDLTLEDVKRSGLQGEFGKVMSTGIASPGVVFSLASLQFRQEFESADLIFAKGMGHYEALSELPTKGKFFYCLMTKCRPVADSLGVPINSYVAMLQ